MKSLFLTNSMIKDYTEFKKFLNKLDYKPKLLLHSCCAPCSTHVLELLNNYFDITVFYSNDNIYPLVEYERRLEEQISVLNKLNIKILFDDQIPNDFYDSIKGYENLGEKSKRCYECYKLRLNKTYLKAKSCGFEYFSTTLSISPHKNSLWINQIGNNLSTSDVKYLYSDFKKDNGYFNSIKLAKENELYRQDYCGCVYSLKEKTKKYEDNL
ncbi:MAG: epoxyqueuosine reductase QueH [Anaeroplasmataceae bacterium]